MDLKNAKPENFMYDVDSDGTEKLSDYWENIFKRIEEKQKKKKEKEKTTTSKNELQ